MNGKAVLISLHVEKKSVYRLFRIMHAVSLMRAMSVCLSTRGQQFDCK